MCVYIYTLYTVVCSIVADSVSDITVYHLSAPPPIQENQLFLLLVEGA